MRDSGSLKRKKKKSKRSVEKWIGVHPSLSVAGVERNLLASSASRCLSLEEFFSTSLGLSMKRRTKERRANSTCLSVQDEDSLVPLLLLLERAWTHVERATPHPRHHQYRRHVCSRGPIHRDTNKEQLDTSICTRVSRHPCAYSGGTRRIGGSVERRTDIQPCKTQAEGKDGQSIQMDSQREIQGMDGRALCAYTR